MTTGTLASSDVEPGPALPSAARQRGRRTLVLLALVCLLPVLASYAMFYLWQPEGRVNNGTLLEPTLLPESTLSGASGQADLLRAELEGRWTLLMAAPAACDESCARALYVSRQARVAQAKEMERVSRVWLITDGVEPGSEPGVGSGIASEAKYGSRASLADELRIAHGKSDWLAALPGLAPGAIYLVDPLGNVMMRFDERTDAIAATRALTKDLQRLLKYSALGRGGRS